MITIQDSDASPSGEKLKQKAQDLFEGERRYARMSHPLTAIGAGVLSVAAGLRGGLWGAALSGIGLPLTVYDQAKSNERLYRDLSRFRHLVEQDQLPYHHFERFMRTVGDLEINPRPGTSKDVADMEFVPRLVKHGLFNPYKLELSDTQAILEQFPRLDPGKITDIKNMIQEYQGLFQDMHNLFGAGQYQEAFQVLNKVENDYIPGGSQWKPGTLTGMDTYNDFVVYKSQLLGDFKVDDFIPYKADYEVWNKIQNDPQSIIQNKITEGLQKQIEQIELVDPSFGMNDPAFGPDTLFDFPQFSPLDPEKLAGQKQNILGVFQDLNSEVSQQLDGLTDRQQEFFRDSEDLAESASHKMGDSFKTGFFNAMDHGLDNLERDLAGLGRDFLSSIGVPSPLADFGADLLQTGVSAVTSTLFGGFMAKGGPVYPGQAYIVGERGPELFMPRTSGQVVPNFAPAQPQTAQPPQVKIQVINNTGQPAEVRRDPPRFDGREWVVTVWMDAFTRNAHGLRTFLGG